MVVYLVCMFLGIALDQILKIAVVKNIPLYDDILDWGFFRITYIRNEGAAFGIFEGKTILLTGLTAVFLLAIFIFLVIQVTKVNRQPKMVLCAMALIVTGGVGNLIDRVNLGYVVDYLSFWSFPVFNLADIMVVVGAGLIILYLLVFENKNKGEDNNGKQEWKS